MRPRRRTPNPLHIVPERVRLAYTDGTESQPLPLVLIGTDSNGMTIWEAMAPPTDERTPQALLVGTLPARTTVRLARSW